MVSTSDFESENTSSNLVGTYLNFGSSGLFAGVTLLLAGSGWFQVLWILGTGPTALVVSLDGDCELVSDYDDLEG